ncbi:MAG: NIPSNAP family protein [Pseudomonadota bacterium]
MAFFELRQYKVRGGKMNDWLDLMEGDVIPHITSKGMVCVASFRHQNDPTIYFWLRRFEDEADKKKLYAAVYESEHWKSILSPKVGELLIREEAIV